MPADMTSFDRVLYEFTQVARDQLSRPLWGGWTTREEYEAWRAEQEANRPTHEEWQAQQAERRRIAEEERSREAQVPIEDVLAGDLLDVSWPGDGEGLSGGWCNVVGVFPFDSEQRPSGLFGHHPVIVVLRDTYGPTFLGPCYERGQVVRRRSPKP